MTSTIRERRQQVAEFLTEQGRAALRVIAEATGLSRSSVHRRFAALTLNPSPPERERDFASGSPSPFWGEGVRG